MYVCFIKCWSWDFLALSLHLKVLIFPFAYQPSRRPETCHSIIVVLCMNPISQSSFLVIHSFLWKQNNELFHNYEEKLRLAIEIGIYFSSNLILHMHMKLPCSFNQVEIESKNFSLHLINWYLWCSFNFVLKFYVVEFLYFHSLSAC